MEDYELDLKYLFNYHLGCTTLYLSYLYIDN